MESHGSTANLRNSKSKNAANVSPCSSSKPSSSLLDILINAEQEIQQNEEANEDPLAAIGNIGDAVINQLVGGTLADVLGEAVVVEDDETVKQNALKLFDKAMSYATATQPPKRKYTRWKAVNAQNNSTDPPATSPIESIFAQYHTNGVKATYPEANFDVSELFQSAKKPEEQFIFQQAKIEEERNQMIANQVAEDIERLLEIATKVYGPKNWTLADKLEFGKFCRNLRSNRGLSMEDRLGIKNFYAKSYSLDDKTATRSSLLFYEEFRKVNGLPPGVISPISSPNSKVDNNPLKRKSNHKEEESAMYPKAEKITMKEESPSESFSLPDATLPFTPFHPGMKYEKEKAFRSEIIQMFLEVFFNNPEPTPKKKVGRPPKTWRPPAPPESDAKDEVVSGNGYVVSLSARSKVNDVKQLMTRLNESMNQEKTWSQKDIDGLERFYDIFREKMTFTIIQTKEFGTYLRKVYGRLEQYELERENDTALQEKRKYWQEYKKNHEPVRRGQAKPTFVPVKKLPPVRPYIRTGIDTTGESEAQKRARKAAYLREWRVRRAEKQNVELSTRLLDFNATLHGVKEEIKIEEPAEADNLN